ncbi:MAG: hypothetical protein DMD81_16815 [Candidatus Rokuibacteriota bacterium]|nr:MAG: hypothetical protein DMD81_16815 [Candidatus Rokubacteria bacterium]
MTTGARETAAAEYRRVLDSAADAGHATDADLRTLAAGDPDALDDALRGFASDRGAGAVPILAIAAERGERAVRRAAKRALYRLAQRGIAAPTPPPRRPVVTKQPERAIRAWVSAIDGSGSRAVWLLFEGGYGGLLLCSTILSDTIGVVEVAGGEISKKRLAHELAALREDQKLPWVETEPGRAIGLVLEALALHQAAGTVPPPDFARWQPLVSSTPPVTPPPPPTDVDPAMLERTGELLELPEMAGWFLDPDAVQSDALALLQARESRLVVSEQIKAEREEAIVASVIDREFAPDARTRWTRRLVEMSLIFRATDRPEHAALADAAAAALAGAAREARHQPFVRALARRSLEIASEVALGRVSAADVSRKPGPVTAGAARASSSPR